MKLPVDVVQETKTSFQHLISLGKRLPDRGRSRKTVTYMAENILVVNDGNFETEVVTASKAQPVMVDFWAEWCRPCHMLAPTVAEIAQDYAGRLKVTKLNVDEAMNSAARFNIRGIPTLLVFKNGQMVEQIVGAVPKDQITKALDRHMG
jgi:thioredoxin 1